MLLRVVVIFLLICAGLQAIELVEADGAVYAEDEPLTDQLNKVWACVVPKLKTGLPEVGIPSLDPLQIDELKLDLDSGYVHLSNVVLNGILDLSFTNVELNAFGCSNGGRLCGDLAASLPSVSLITDYGADVTLFDTLRIYGSGNISLAAHELAPSLSISLSLSPSIEINDLKINVALNEFDFQVTGLLNDEYMSKLISNMIKDIIGNHLTEIVDTVTNLLLSEIENGDGGAIDTDKLFAILGALLSGCLDTNSVDTLEEIDSLLRRR